MKTDREKLIEWLIECCEVNHCSDTTGKVRTCTECFADYLISKGVTIPVRCGECKHWNPTDKFNVFGECLKPLGEYGDAIETDTTDFCSYGERKEDGN